MSANNKTIVEKNRFWIVLMAFVLIGMFSRILFTDQIIRAPDIIQEYYWGVLEYSKRPLSEIFHFRLHAPWDIYGNTGNTLEGGGLGNQFLFWQGLIYFFIRPPASVAWFIVLHFFLGSAGVYLLCRTIGASRLASFLGALTFSLAPEMVSLINAGHVLKIATISVAPWAFYMLERGFQTRRIIWFMATGFVLALQFFYIHWQIAYYTCLCVGAYGVCRSIGILLAEREKRGAVRLVGLNMVVLVFFMSTVAMDLFPLASWSTETNRGAMSGANQGKGGLDREEAMSWSMPPEELAALVIPGLFGFSRQEAGENPANIHSYYWGRMVFTQTTSYFGLLPLLLLPLPLIFRRDRYTWLAMAAVAMGILFSMGKYTLFYNVLYDHFPGINRFRVPKMIMFIPVLGVGVLAARGFDLLRDEGIRQTRAFRRYLIGVACLPAALLVLLGIEHFGRNYWMGRFIEMLSQPTRYEQGPQLVAQRWNNLIRETGIAAAFAACYGLTIIVGLRKPLIRVLPLVLLGIFLLDVGRVNSKFMFLVDVPKTSKRDFTSPAIEFLKTQSKEFRVLPLGTGGGPYVTRKIPVIFTPMPVQQRRWQEYLDNLALTSAMADIINLKYLVASPAQYQQERSRLGDKYVPVFQSPDGSEVVLENRTVMPKAWLVPSVLNVAQPQQALGVMQSPQFDPRQLALVESPPPLPLAQPGVVPAAGVGSVRIKRYEGEHIDISVTNAAHALLVLGEKYYKGWKATVDGKSVDIQRVNYILRGVYLPPGDHKVEFVFDPLPFKIGKYLTLASLVLFAGMLVREWLIRRKRRVVGG